MIPLETVEQSMFGLHTVTYCTACEGLSEEPLESDAYNYPCEQCGASKKSSVEELLMRNPELFE